MVQKILFTTFLFFVSLSAKDTVSLQLLWKHQFEFAGYYMAKEKGFYESIDLNVSHHQS